jgi:hypothetical protein
MTAGYLDTRVYALYDRMPALCYGPYSRNIHGVDECVSLSSVKRMTGAIALFIADWCGTEPIAEIRSSHHGQRTGESGPSPEGRCIQRKIRPHFATHAPDAGRPGRRRTGNLRAVQLLIGHTKMESTVRYLGVEVDDALEIAEKIEV